MWITFAIVLYVIVAITIVISLLLHGARPSKTLAWLLAIFTIPVGGILLYIVLGRNRRKNKLLKQRDLPFPKLPRGNYDAVSPFRQGTMKLMRLVERNSLYPPTCGNEVRILKDGRSTFEAIFAALSSARRQIHLQYYIFEEGELAERLFRLFEQKRAEGVVIRLIYDGIGSFSLSRSYRKKLLQIGVEVYSFLPFRFGKFLASLNYRNHRKIIVVDGRIAFTGGINISDKYLKGDSHLGSWHDMHMEIKGDAATYFDHIFAMDWHLVSERNLDVEMGSADRPDKVGETWVQVVAGGPDDDFSSIGQAYFAQITQAEHYLYIINPYLIPGQAILQALQTAALSGVDVRILISEKADNWLVGWSVRSYFESLLKAGVKIYLFSRGFLHSKTMVSDDHVSSIGTANLDDRSFEQNYEVNALVYDERMAKSLRDDFLRDAEGARQLSYEVFRNRPRIEKLKEGFGKIFSPIL